MSDFIIQFGNLVPAEQIVRALSQRPWLQDRPIHVKAYPWGQLILQEPPGAGYAPLYRCEYSDWLRWSPQISERDSKCKVTGWIFSPSLQASGVILRI